MSPTLISKVRPESARTPEPTVGVHHWFERQAEKTPGRIALSVGSRTLTYSMLNERANQLAWRLKAMGVGPNTPVGICLERTPDLLIAVYSVLKAGGMYVPLDPSYPSARLTYMLDSLDCPVIISSKEGGPRDANNRRVVHIDSAIDKALSTDNLPPASSLGDLIYTIFTSGSTGRPKGAAVYHRGFANLLEWFIQEFQIGPHDRALLVSSFSFDLTQKNLFATLAVGGTLHLLPPGPYDPSRVGATIHSERITLLNCTPSAAYPLFEEGVSDEFASYRSLRHLFLGGEPISTRRLRPWTSSKNFQCEIVNTYGPTECSDVCAFHVLQPSELTDDLAIPIGRPIAHTQLTVLGDDMAECAVGVPGELCISGRGVGAGYITDAHLNAARFVPNAPAGDLSGERLYRTGDIARRRPDGVLDFLGRADHQVKIRGFRIELGEIEATLETHSDVKSAVVVPRQSNDDALPGSLAAYVVARNYAVLEATSLRQFLRQRLPEHMIPAVVIVLEALPLSPNGKVDRGALLEPSTALPDPRMDSPEPISSREIVTTRPAADLESIVAEIWCAALQVDRIGMDENFFDAGGDSLLAIEVHRRLCLALPTCGISVTMLFEHSTVRALCSNLEIGQTPPPTVPSELSPAQERAKRQRSALASGYRAGRTKAARSERSHGE